MPVSKKRKKKKRTGPPPPKNAVAPKKKITRQQIIIYIISAVMILSLAIGFLASGSRRSQTNTPATPLPQDNILLETPAPGDDQAAPQENEAAPDTTPESTEGN